MKCRPYWYSNDFPAGMSTDRLYPEKSSVYTLPDERGEVDVTCSSRASMKATAKGCPDPFLQPTMENSVETCVHPCPVPAFSDGEYELMWGCTVTPGGIGFVLNTFVVATWYIGGRDFMKKVPHEFRNCIIAGLLYNVVETFPLLFWWKSNIACGDCGTDECIGEDAFCYINRTSPYFLMVILLNMMMLLFRLFSDIKHNVNHSKFVKRKGRDDRDMHATLFHVFMTVAFVVEGDDEGSDNKVLNAARHSFKCSMRFVCALAFFGQRSLLSSMLLHLASQGLRIWAPNSSFFGVTLSGHAP
jgi:hypothetical protein